MKMPNKELVCELRDRFPVGCRVELVYMDDTQAPPVGTLGTVYGVDDAGTIHINWDNGCGLEIAYGVDRCQIVS